MVLIGYRLKVVNLYVIQLFKVLLLTVGCVLIIVFNNGFISVLFVSLAM